MKVNLPVTDHEYDYDPSLKLISTTDVRGIITHANEAFWDVSGYEQDELLHHNHNVIRHPDMPEQVFKDMWERIKEGYPWEGVIKNRRKNGDYYWVYAYVTAVYSQGEMIGFQSVRTHPTREQVAEAEAYYRQLRQGEREGAASS